MYDEAMYKTSFRNWCTTSLSHVGTNKGYHQRPWHRRTKTGDFITDNYTVRQAKFIRLETLKPQAGKRDLRILLPKMLKLNDTASYEIVVANYPEVITELENEPVSKPITDEEFDRLIKEKAEL